MIQRGGARRGVRHQRHGINNRSVTVSLPGQLDTEVRRLAARQGISVSMIVTRALEMLLTVSGSHEEREERTA